MRLDYFRFKFKRECDFIEIADKVVLSRKPKIVYDYNRNTETKYKQLDDVLDYDVGNKKTILDCINEMKDFPTMEFDGGRGASSGGSKSYKFKGRERHGFSKNLPPAIANTKIKSKTYQGALNEFKRNHLLAKREFAYVVGDNGYVYEYAKGGRHSVGVSNTPKLRRGEKTMLIHNHPSGSAFSSTDLLTASSDSLIKGVVASGKNYDYTFKKGGHFKGGSFQNAVRHAKFKGNNYDDAVDKWLRKNQKTYGYTYSRTKN